MINLPQTPAPPSAPPATPQVAALPRSRIHSGLIFSVVTLFCIAFLGYQIRGLLPLYTDGALRARVLDRMRAVSTEHGWLVSDLSVQQIDARRIRVLYHPHMRGSDSVTCLFIPYDQDPYPCDD